jgi:hypothetical protein
VPAEPFAIPSEFDGLVRGLARHFYPPLAPLLGILPLTRDTDGPPVDGGPCPRCGAVRVDGGDILPGTGIQAGCALVCVSCDAMEPARECRARHHAKPSRPRAESKPRPTRLTARERRSLIREPRGRAWVAMLDAEAAGDQERAARLQSGLYGFQDGHLSLEDLATLTDEVLGIATVAI